MGYVLPCKALIQTLGSSHYLSQTHTHTHTHTHAQNSIANINIVACGHQGTKFLWNFN
jgi:hypothetical protein